MSTSVRGTPELEVNQLRLQLEESLAEHVEDVIALCKTCHEGFHFLLNASWRLLGPLPGRGC